MTVDIRMEIATWEHTTKQPPGLRYALLCDAYFRGDPIECVSSQRMGHLGSFPDYEAAKENAINHPHRAFIKFYPDENHPEPSREFIRDFNTQQVIQANREAAKSAELLIPESIVLILRNRG